jgi:two-component system CheB/CheR fusion protein
LTSTDDSNGGQPANAGHISGPTDFAARAMQPFPIVGIGASAGGIQALEQFFDNVAPDSGMAYVVVQHLSPDHTSLLGDILGRRAKIPVHEITDGMAIEADNVYVIAPGYTLTISAGRLHLGEPVEKRGHRRPVDDFFRSLADEQAEKAFAIVLSGTGSNGSAGCQAIKAAGGICIAQDPETAAFPGMPQSLIHTGYADQVLEPKKIPAVLHRFAAHSSTNRGDVAPPDEESHLQRDRVHLREILAILRTRTRHDFSGYRKPTILRRIQRRMNLAACEGLQDYAGVLREHPDEVISLANDLMINVTGFFRDAEAWDALRSAVIAPLVAARAADGQPIRAWVTACASGEEAYTLAMVITEELRGHQRVEVKIFATDTAERSLGLARAGVYPGGIEADLSPERLDRFFDREEHTFRIKKEIRDMVVFSPQDVLRDPPFSRLDLCSCRNFLIYLEPETQRRVLALLHFSLRDGGHLFLGNTESYSGSEQLFELVSKRWRIYRRTGIGRHRFAELPSFAARDRDEAARPSESTHAQVARSSATLVLQRALLERYGPPTVVVDRSDNVVYFHGATQPFLQQPPGEATHDLMQLVRAPLRMAVQTALRTAMRDNRRAMSQTSPYDDPHQSRVEVVAEPVIDGQSPQYFLVSFRALEESTSPDATTPQPPERVVAKLPRDLNGMSEVRMLRLELQSTTEAFEAANEELKAANEEATSMNEELQSTNEELETSKEELQSVNEELNTVNLQLQNKIALLEATTNDLANLLSSTDIAVVFLDAEFRVRRFTPAVNDLMELRETDIGRPITDLAQKFSDDKLLSDARAVLQKLVPVDREVRSSSGRWYLRRTLPYRTAENHIEGVVVTFIDIAGRKRSEEEILAAKDRLQGVLEQMPTAVIILQAPSGRMLFANERAGEMFGYSFPTPVPAEGGPVFYPILSGTNGTGELYRSEQWPLARSLALDQVVRDEEITVKTGDGGTVVLSVAAAPVKNAAGETVAVVGTFLDITQRKAGEHKLSQVEERFRLLVESAKDFAIFYLDSRGKVVTWNPGAENILGWTEAEIVGQSGAIIFTPEDRATFIPDEEMRQAAATGRATDERWHLRKDGTRFWASGVLASVSGTNGMPDGFVKILRDSTTRKLGDERLQAAMASAEEAKERATEANRAKDEFISIVSHELRTPLNTIRLWARMMRNEKLAEKDRLDGIGMIERATVAQQQVIDDLFDVSRIASGKLRLALRETRLADAIRGAVVAVEPVAQARGLTLDSRIENEIGVVRADPGRIQQVVWNLLSNAVKFTPSGGRVEVVARRVDATVCIEVTDTGIGIRRDFLPSVFERFKQAEVGTARAHNGLGLGLSIAKQLVEMHGGTIEVASEGEGRGATFRIHLPLAQHAEADEQATNGEAGIGDLGGADILLVEDEANSRETMRRLLEGRNAQVRAVDSAGAARDAITTRRPQLLISDIGLPGEDGYSLIRHVRSQPGERIAALAVTAFARAQDRQHVLEAGFDEHLTKPLDPDCLLALVAKLLHPAADKNVSQ